ncbi:MAG: hypothetical protein JXA18_03960 [Chitinispirillaceae bacterium]|nr:hypothetical protein [Chitinispirillaceae bacterium]
MKTDFTKWQFTISVVLLVGSFVGASNLANPAITLPEARIAIGASYHLGGYSLTNDTVPALFNRIHGRFEYGPYKHLTLGIDAGAVQIEVDRYHDTVPVFHGKFGFSGGAHLKLSTPSFAKKIISFIAIVQATLFKSQNKHSAYYGGKDGTGIIGIQLHIPGFGYISAGPWVYLIQGENSSFNGKKNFYSNTDNVRGWLAIDYFPKIADVSSNKPYLSFEFSISPKATYSERIPVQAFSVSISIGSITRRLYGTESDVEWSP